MIRALRAVLVTVAAAALGGLTFANPALASATVTPDQAVQGGDASLEFRITNDRPKAYTKTVEIVLPDDSLISEVFPFSVPDWAPKITYRVAPDSVVRDKGLSTNQLVSSVIWIAVGGAALTPGQPQTLPMDLGPMPNASTFTFKVIQTYSDGTVVRSDGQPGNNAAPVLKLLPNDGTTTSHSHGGGTTTDTGTQAAAPQPVANSSDDSGISGTGFALALAGAALIAGLLAGVIISRGRRSPELTAVLNGDGDDDEEEPAKASKAAAGSRT